MPKIEDEEGVPWFVKSGDPARQAVVTLERRGYKYIVLTRRRLAGMLDESVGETDATPPTPLAFASPADLIRSQRLHDCIEEIRELP